MYAQSNLAEKELRKFARLDIALTVSYALRDQHGQLSELAEAQSSDISAGGLRLMTPTKLNSGDIIDLEINIHGSEAEAIHAHGEVVWQNKLANNSFETGTIIKYMSEPDKQRFLGFVFDQMARVVGHVNFSAH